ncbi:hypothetical protein Rhe02_80660 [Rhizocola hellebori]|uniref:Beta-lactamase class A catalytic domain-containing protein n=1 Tax=Rhizocola hellebori TaxID=1392758 RepID=A0A8J3VK25_9ACTN|nr:serine hydrolase [Rhizocola hellebori]GIH09999.1 hypothetical protein Rhe02_80660 [Rhizocola hellebori]
MKTPVSRRRALIAGSAGLVTLAVGAPLLLKQAAVNANRGWVDPGQQTADEPSSPKASPTPATPPFDLATIDPTKLVTVTAEGWFSWALMDRKNGAIIGSPNYNQTNRACSMIKTWIAADYLSQAKTPTKTRLDQITIMIRDSDSLTADDIMDELGRLKSFNRMKAVCKTTDFTPGSSWSKAVISARDTCRLADTVAAGRVANAEWTNWLLDLMRNVRRGSWGVRAAFPPEVQAKMAIKNGWDTTSAKSEYHANCLAVTDRWSMAVLTRYPLSVKANETHGAAIAESIAKQLLERPELQPLFGKGTP